MSSEFDAFDCSAQINDGVKLDLTLPDGSPSGQWIKVRNFRSDAYREALAALQAKHAEKGRPSAAEAKADRLNLLATLISEWSFKTPLTKENAVAFLGKAMLVPEQIDRLCVDDSRFFGNGSTDSTNGPKPK